MQASAPGATVQIDSVVPGSVRVSARVAFPASASGLVAGYSCALGTTTPCGSLVTTLASNPGALFATSSTFASIPVTAAAVNVALLGGSTVVAVAMPPPPVLLSPPPQSGGVPPVMVVTPPPPGGTPPSSSSSSLGSIVGAVVGAGVIGPGAIFSILAIFFKPLLRKLLLKYGFKRLADCVVPDMQGDVAMLTVKMAELQAFMAKDVKKLPRLKDVTPELDAANIELDASEPLGKGGFGVVYRGVLNGQQTVAVKALFSAQGPSDAVIPADVKKKMRQEATIMCSLNHPNVLHVFGVVPERGWIVMELCAGGALSELLLDAEQALDAPTLVRLAAETATGVAYLHTDEIKIVHGDLKAANVLLTAERSVRICDFGMAEAKDRSKSMTSVGMGGGSSAGITVAWTAPEVLQNEDKSFASDVFALGVTLWEVLERAKPFGRMPDMAAVNQLLNGARPALTSKTPARAAKVIAACWAQDAKKRCTAAEAACVLTELRRGGGGGA